MILHVIVRLVQDLHHEQLHAFLWISTNLISTASLRFGLEYYHSKSYTLFDKIRIKNKWPGQKSHDLSKKWFESLTDRWTSDPPLLQNTLCLNEVAKEWIHLNVCNLFCNASIHGARFCMPVVQVLPSFVSRHATRSYKIFSTQHG